MVLWAWPAAQACKIDYVMTQHAKPISYDDFVEHIDEHFQALTETGGELRVAKSGYVYSVKRADEHEEGLWTRYDPERLRRTIEAHRYNALPGVDIEALKRDLKAARSQDSHGRPA